MSGQGASSAAIHAHVRCPRQAASGGRLHIAHGGIWLVLRIQAELCTPKTGLDGDSGVFTRGPLEQGGRRTAMAQAFNMLVY